MELDTKSTTPKKTPRPIYLDNQATTPLDPQVLQAMAPYLEAEFGNPSSKNHSYGWKADMAVKNARTQVAHLLNALPEEIYWTSGATESNNLVIQGLSLKLLGQKPHLITSAVEHKAVLESCEAAAELGAEVTVLPVNSFGQVEREVLEKAMRPNTKLVSLMAANNEIGTRNPIHDLAEIAHRGGALFHCDAVQGVGKFAIDLKDWNVDFLSLSGHKIYGPKGIGALFVRKGKEQFLRPLFFGGEQECGLRPGTLNVPGIVGLGKACELCGQLLESESRRLRGYQQKILEALHSVEEHFILNGHPTQRLCNNLSLSFPKISADVFPLSLSGLAYSSGSACTSGSGKPSHVLKAIGLEDLAARATLRIGLGRFTSESEVEQALEKILQMVKENTV
ncbi:MAG: cysteine desulfurase [Bdellovibrionales bacterium]|nr:cysteine desulfurase [Bdellovibrionales bacterium]